MAAKPLDPLPPGPLQPALRGRGPLGLTAHSGQWRGRALPAGQWQAESPRRSAGQPRAPAARALPARGANGGAPAAREERPQARPPLARPGTPRYLGPGGTAPPPPSPGPLPVLPPPPAPASPPPGPARPAPAGRLPPACGTRGCRKVFPLGQAESSATECFSVPHSPADFLPVYFLTVLQKCCWRLVERKTISRFHTVESQGGDHHPVIVLAFHKPSENLTLKVLETKHMGNYEPQQVIVWIP